MCLILFRYDPDGEHPLTVMANRDEFHGRKTRQVGFWDDAPHILAGRDLEKGGTWMGVTRRGRFAALTNYRSLADMHLGWESRGELTRQFLEEEVPAGEYAERVLRSGDRYTGFNLLVYDGQDLIYVSNRSGQPPVRVGPGFHGLSNALLDTPWPKVTRGVQAFQASVRDGNAAVDWIGIMSDTEAADDDQLPDTGIGLEKERRLSSRFIDSPGYGTRCTSFVQMDRNGAISFVERTLVPEGLDPDTVRFSILPDETGGWNSEDH
jgi:uncharacterized protein with NRDE domain